MTFRIAAIIVAVLLGFGTGMALMTELSQPTKTVVEPIDLEVGNKDAGDDVGSGGDKRPQRKRGEAGRDGQVILPGNDDEDEDEGAQPVPAPAPARAGDEVDDDADDANDDEGSRDDD